MHILAVICGLQANIVFPYLDGRDGGGHGAADSGIPGYKDMKLPVASIFHVVAASLFFGSIAILLILAF